MSGILSGIQTATSAVNTATNVVNAVNNLAGAGASLLSSGTIGPASTNGAALFGATGPVVLGTVAFDGFEVPDKIVWGGSQRLTVHKFPGGTRVIDAMGPDDKEITWAGVFLSGDAVSRANSLDAIRQAGIAVPLVWSTFNYKVIVSNVEFDHRKPGHVPYRISCTVLLNPTQQQQQSGPSGIAAAASVGQRGVTSALSGVSSALSSASSTITSVIAPIQAVVGQVAAVITPITNALGISIPLLGQTQAALSLAGGFAGSLSGAAAGLTSVDNTVAALNAGAASAGDTTAAMGGVIDGVNADAPSGSIVSGPADLQAATYASGVAANTSAASGYAGAAAISTSATATGQDVTPDVTDRQAGAYSDPSALAQTGQPSTSISSTAQVLNTSGDPTQNAYMTRSTTYDANGVGTTTYIATAATPGGLTAADVQNNPALFAPAPSRY